MDYSILYQKADYVFGNGEFAANRIYYGFGVNLYVIDGQYFEVFLDQSTYDIEKIELVEEVDVLKAYLNGITLKFN